MTGCLKNSIVIAVIFSVSALSLAEAAESAKELTFSEFYSRVLEYYPKLKEQSADVGSALAGKLEAAAGLMPSLKGLSSVTVGDDQVYVFGTLLKQKRFTNEDFALSRINTPKSQTNYNFTLRGEMVLFDAFSTVYKMREAALKLGASMDEKELVKTEALLIASEAFLNAVMVDRVYGTLEVLIKNSEEDLKQAEDLTKQGLILGADFYAAKVTLGKLRAERNTLLQEKRASYALLNILMGSDPETEFVISADIAGNVPGGVGLAEWLARAYQGRYDILAYDKRINAQEIEVKRRELSFLPTMKGFADIQENTQNLYTGGQSYMLGIAGEMDIFDPAYGARVKGAKAELKKIRYERDMLKDTIARDINQAYSQFESNRANLPVIEEMNTDAKQAVDMMLPLYREGRKSIADLLEIRHAFLGAVDEYYAAHINSKIAYARLCYLSGRLGTDDLEFILSDKVK